MAGRKTTKTLSRVFGQQMDLLNKAKKDLAKAINEISNKDKRSALSSSELEKIKERVKTLKTRVFKLGQKVNQNTITKAIADPANKNKNKSTAPTTKTRASIQSSLKSVGRTLLPLGVGFAVSSMYNKKDENKVEDKDRGSPSKPSKVVTAAMDAAKKRLAERRAKKSSPPSRPKDFISGQKTTTILKDDTYGKISKRFNVPIDKLRKLNNYEDKKLPIGKTLKLK